MTGHIMKPNSIIVKIVENCHANFITLSVVRLRTRRFGTSSVGPVDIVVSLSRGPSDVTPVNLSTSPEVSLSVFGNKSKKFLLFG